MTDDRQKLPQALINRIEQIGRDCILAGLSAEQTIEQVNIEARKHGIEYRVRAK